MLLRKAPDVRSSEITPKSAYLNRRDFLGGSAAVAGAAAISAAGIELAEPLVTAHASSLPTFSKSPLSTSERMTPQKDVTSYNNFYEFSTDKYGPAELAKNFKTRPWTVKVEGLVKTPKTVDIDALLKQNPLEERIYRHR